MLDSSLFTQSCLLCSARNGGDFGICTNCLNDLPHHTPSHAASCPQCGLLSFEGQLCGACIASPPDFDATIALFRYEYPISQVLQQYKYNQQLFLAETFAELMMQKIQAHNIDLIIPMPLHPSRLQERVKNMKGAFTCNEDLSELRIALLDDVMTTGASLNALAKAVKAKGATHVECWLIARTLAK